MDETMDTKIDLRIVKTQKKLALAFKEMMLTTSFNDITVFDLCTRAGVRRATFYKHFDDKYDFLRSIISHLVNDLAYNVSSACDMSNPVEYFAMFVTEIFNYFDQRKEILNNILTTGTLHIFTDIIMSCTHTALIENINDAKENGIKIFADVSAVAAFINGGITSLLLATLKDSNNNKEETILQLKLILSKLFE